MKKIIMLVMGVFFLSALSVNQALAADLVVSFDTQPPVAAIAGDTPTFGSLTTFSFVVNVENDDLLVSDPAVNPVFEFFVPENTFVTMISQDGDTSSCQAGTPGDPNNPASCRLGDPDLAPGDDVDIAVELHVNADTPELTLLDIDIQACYEVVGGDGAPRTSCAGDFYPTDNENHAFTFVNTAADLNIVKTHTSANSPLNAGESIDYVSTVTNSGPSVARGLIFEDELPAGVVFDGVEIFDQHGSRIPIGGDLNCGFQATAGPAGTVRCELGDLPPGQPIQPQLRIDIATHVDSGAAGGGGSICNSSSVKSLQTTNFTAETDFAPFAGDISNDDCVTVNDRAEVVLRMSSTPLNPVAGGQVLWTYEIENVGPSDATGLLFTDTLPQGTSSTGDPIYFDYVDDQAHGFCTETSSSPSVISCRPAGSPFSAPAYVLPAGESVTFSILVGIHHELLGRYTNTGQVSVSNTNFSITSLNDDVEVGGEADLRIMKFAPPTVEAGAQLTYTILVDNLGPSTARNLVVRDTLISDGFFRANGCSLAVRTEGGAIDEFNCNFALSQGVFDLATMGVSHLQPRNSLCNSLSCGDDDEFDPGRMIITINGTANEQMFMNNLVDVVSETFDPDVSNNSTTAPTEVLAIADLGVVQTADAPQVLAGTIASWTIVVDSDGPSTAEGVYLEDLLPAALVDGTVTIGGQLVGTDSGGASVDEEIFCTTGTPGDPLDPAICDLLEFPPDTTATITVSGLVDPSFIAEQPAIGSHAIQNDVRIYSATPDVVVNCNGNACTASPIGGRPNVATSAIEIIESSSITVTKTDGPVPALAGGQVTYRISLANSGPSTARNLRVVDELTTGAEYLTFAGLSVLGGSGICVGNPGASPENVTCQLGDVEPTVTPLQILLTFDVDPLAPVGTVLGDALTVTADSAVVVAGDLVEETTVTRVADVSVEKLALAPNGTAGDSLTYTITLENHGPSWADNVMLSDPPPPGTSVISVNSDACDNSVSCDFGNLAPGATRTFEVVLDIKPGYICGAPLINTATAVHDGQDTIDHDLANNAGVSTVPVQCQADLKTTAIIPAENVGAGEEFTVTLFIDNFGPSQAETVQIMVDKLTSGAVSFVDITSNRVIPIFGGLGLCSATADGARCALIGALEPWEEFPPPGAQSGRWRVDLTMIADQAQKLVVSACSISGSDDPNTENNCTQDSVLIGDVADLVVNKTSQGEVLVAGQAHLELDLLSPPAFPDTPHYVAEQGQVTPGRRVRYTIEVTNHGPSPASNVLLTEKIPADVVVVPGSLTVTQGSCSLGTPGDVTNPTRCGLGELAASASATVTFDVAVDDEVELNTLLVSDVSVESDNVDPDNSNNSAFQQTLVKLNDYDNDGVFDTVDNCPLQPNPLQADFDNDGIGDKCDLDGDNDGMSTAWENDNQLNPYDPSDANRDQDGDGFTNRAEYGFDSDPNVFDKDENMNGVPDKIDARRASVLPPLLYLL